MVEIELLWNIDSTGRIEKSYVTISLYSIYNMCGHVCSLAQSYPTLWPYGFLPTRLLCLWDFPARILGSGLLFLPPGVSSQSRSSTRFLHLLHCRWILYHWATGGALFRILQDLYPSLLFKCIVRIFRYATLKSISSVQSLSHVQLFATPWTTPGSPVHPNSWSLLKLM